MQIAKCKLPISDVTPGTVDGDEVARKPMTPEAMCDRVLDFADRVTTVVEALPTTRIGNRIANQLLRSGTSSIGNYEEACAAESKDDFVHKLRICLKAVRESRVASANRTTKTSAARALGRFNRRSGTASANARTVHCDCTRGPKEKRQSKAQRLLNCRFAICNLHFAISEEE